MKKMRMNLLAVTAVGFLLGLVLVEKSAAEVRVDARVKTPHVRVRISNAPIVLDGVYKKKHPPVRKKRSYGISKRDRAIAHRLAQYTGAPARKLLKLRRRGYSWFKIGRFLNLRAPVVYAAGNQRRWNRFLFEESRMARCGRPHERFRVSMFEQFEFDR